MPKWAMRTIRIMLAIVIILFVIAGIWTCKTRQEPQVMTVKKAFEDIEDYGWTPTELKRITERKVFLIECEELLVKLDKNTLYWANLRDKQLEFIEEYGGGSVE